MTAEARPAHLEDVLAGYRERVAEEIDRRLPRGEPRRWLYEPMSDYPHRTGKALRAALCLTSCGAFGGDEEEALAVAAAIELTHCAFLVHDDIQDGSRFRRGAPTLHRAEGMPLALNAGNALALMGFEVLRAGSRRFGQRLSGRIMDEFSKAVWRTLEGQAMELGWRRDGVVELTTHDYLTMVLGKTCYYSTIAPLRIGTLIGSRGTAELVAMSRFGLFLGAAFQITDDILNVNGDDAGYGKESRGDLREGKRTLMVIHLLSVAEPDDRRVLVELLRRGDGQCTDGQLGWLTGLFQRYGSIGFAQDFARGVADAAAAALPSAFRAAPHSAHTDVIHALVDYMVERTR